MLVYCKMFERAGLHAREPGQLCFNLCIIGTRVYAPYVFYGGHVLFALVSVAVVHCILVPWREYQFYRGRARADPRILRFIREDRVVFVSVYALGVCTSASGLWHFLDYLNI